jgi:hypothetical protein
MAYPANGVIYVHNGTCSAVYSPYSVNYSANTGCGNATVDSGTGTYNTSLTIGAENDIVVDGNILSATGASSSGNPLLGLIANNFVRVYHPISGSRSNAFGSCGTAANGSGYLANPEIDAAILAIKDSFIVDNYDCGAQSQLGSLKVYGSIAQNYRGAVGTSGNPQTGYLKNYNYDDDLLYREPPHFLDPVFAAWSIQRQTVTPAGT